MVDSCIDNQAKSTISNVDSNGTAETKALLPPLNFKVLPPTPVPHTIASGEIVILRDFQGNQKIVRVNPKSSVNFGGRNPFPLRLLVNGHYGMTFRYEKNKWIQCLNTSEAGDHFHSVNDIIHDKVSNQSLLYDSNTAQSLSANEIRSLQKDLSGEKLVDYIVKNSSSFTNKTTFSQQKYIFKKKKKHLQQLLILDPTLFNICETYYNLNPIKIAGLRFDYLSLALCYADIQLCRRVMLFDHSMGLLTSAVALKLQGTGDIFKISQNKMSSKIERETPLSSAMLATIKTIPFDVLNLDDPSIHEWFSFPENALAEPSQKKPHRIAGQANFSRVESADEKEKQLLNLYGERWSTFENLQREGVHAFIGVFSSYRCFQKLHELQHLIESCLRIAHRYLRPDGKLVLFCGNMQPLSACQAFLHTTTEYLHIKLEEILLREHQILPYRSHPIMRGSARLVEGFLLSAIKVEKHVP